MQLELLEENILHIQMNIVKNRQICYRVFSLVVPLYSRVNEGDNVVAVGPTFSIRVHRLDPNAVVNTWIQMANIEHYGSSRGNK